MPYELNKSISKFNATSKDSLTDVLLNPAFKFYWDLKKGDIIRDSFEIENRGTRNDFKIDYLNNGMNTLRVLTPIYFVRRGEKKKIIFEYIVDNNFIENNKLFFFILVAGNSTKNISGCTIRGTIKQ